MEGMGASALSALMEMEEQGLASGLTVLGCRVMGRLEALGALGGVAVVEAEGEVRTAESLVAVFIVGPVAGAEVVEAEVAVEQEDLVGSVVGHPLRSSSMIRPSA